MEGWFVSASMGPIKGEAEDVIFHRRIKSILLTCQFNSSNSIHFKLRAGTAICRDLLADSNMPRSTKLDVGNEQRRSTANVPLGPET